MEGNPLDRLVYFGLILVGLLIVLMRKRAWQILRMNGTILLFFAYAAVSISWSDYPGIAAKRWIKALGDFVMVLIVVSDRDRVAAIRAVLTRTGFLLIPFSILFIKYYPDLGRGYSRWEGTAFYNGVATTKNALGMICMIFGLSALWRILVEIRIRFRTRRMTPMYAQGTVLVMTIWLFSIINSMTSLWCFFIGATLLTVTRIRAATKRMTVIHGVVGILILIPLAMLFFHVGADVAHGATGRDISTLTDRTQVWAESLKLAGSALVGAGFESFWLGERLERMWTVFWWHPNEAHNGYLEIFLNLGWIGIGILALVIGKGYRTVIDGLRRNTPESALMLSSFAVTLVYNFTEAAFFRMMVPVWFLFLMAITKTPSLVPAIFPIPQETPGQRLPRGAWADLVNPGAEMPFPR
jgi:hypothetical protein